MKLRLLFDLLVALVIVSLCPRGNASPKITGQLQETTYSVISLSWAKTWGGISSDIVHNIAVDGAVNVYVTGEFTGTVDFDPGLGVDSHTSNGGVDVFLSKFDANGNFLWVRTWGGSGRDVPNGIGVDKSGNIYVSGPYQYTVDFDPGTGTDIHSSNAGSMNNVFLSKFDANGNYQWVRTWGPSDGGSESYSLALDSANNIYVEGDFTGSSTNYNPWDTLHPDWHINHPGPIANFDAFLSKFDSNGNFQWVRTWGGEGYDDGPGVAVDGLGNVYVAGMYASKTIDFDPAGGGASYPAHDSGFVVDVFLSKFDSNGNFQWVRTWGSQGTDDAAETVIVDGANNVYVSGRYGSISCNFNPWGVADYHSSNGSLDAFLSKFDSNGNFQWARTWGGTGWDAAGGLAVDGANNVYVTGDFAGTVSIGTTTVLSNGGEDVFFCKYDSNGNFQWVKTWGGSTDDYGYHVAVNSAGDTYYVVGSFQNITDLDPGTGVDSHISNGLSDGFLSKFISPVSTDVKLSRFWMELE